MIIHNKISQINIDEILNKLKFNEQGLIVAIAQDSHTNKVLMQAWMNIESIKQTIDSGLATYFSRSRNEIWQKGKTSGNFQKIISLTADCDYDCILLIVDQQGVACHTGKENCFFNNIV
jgi:phosphoribosyl-AMP cyclohydrolase